MSFLGGCIDVDDLTEVRPGVVADSRPVPNTGEDLTEVFHGNGVIAVATTAENASLICNALNHCYEAWLKERQPQPFIGPFHLLIGRQVKYISRSARTHQATITGIPENPKHGYTPLPTVSLEFRDPRGKLVKMERVVPEGPGCTTAVWKL